MKRSEIKHIASEIVRSMTNHRLNQNQKYILEHNAKIVLENKLLKYIEDIPIETKTKQGVDDALF